MQRHGVAFCETVDAAAGRAASCGVTRSPLGRLLTATLGLLLLAAGLLPVAVWLLDPGATGPAGAATRDLVGALHPSVVLGSLGALAAAWVGARTPAAAALGTLLGSWIPAPRGRARASWAIACGVLATTGAMAVHTGVLDGRPTLVDEMVQLADARDLGGALPLPVDPAFRVLANGRVVGEGTDANGAVDGWVSIYPVGHTALLALKLGVGGAAGHLPVALLWGATVGLATMLLFLLAGAPAAVVGGLLTAASPFGWLLAAGSLSHVSAAFGVALALLGAVLATRRTEREALLWAVAVGVGAGIAVNARPLAGLALAVGVPLVVWGVDAGRAGEEGALRILARRCAGAVAGGLPLLLLLLGSQLARFGHPLRSGYLATFGPAHGLGWHVDPWGNDYDATAAAGATAADLFTMGIAVLESPVPLGVLIGAGALLWALSRTELAPRPDRPVGPGFGSREGDDLLLLGLWVSAAVAANALYWHHGNHFGPRMLFETLPAWVGLAVVLGDRLLRSGSRRRGAVLVVALFAVLGSAVIGIPRRLATAVPSEASLAATRPPAAPADDAIVFVHGSAARRTTARLQALGVRGDSIESAIRRNDLCEVAAWADVRRGTRPPPAPDLDFTLTAGTPADLMTVETGPGVFSRLAAGPGGAPYIDPDCVARVIGPDRVGTIELDPLLWAVEGEGALEGTAPLFVRDLGPEDNARLLEALPGRPAWVLLPDAGGVPRYEPYAEAMERIWGAAGAAQGA